MIVEIIEIRVDTDMLMVEDVVLNKNKKEGNLHEPQLTEAIT